MSRIFLIGYMGSGKTTIGKLLAARLGYRFLDIDTTIEEKYFKSISQIFVEKGEPEFRLIEKQNLHDLAEFENVVISTGGGAPCFFDNMDYMKAHGITIYLKLSAAQLTERLESSHDGKRPLLADRKGAELLQFIAAGLAKREPFYSKAQFIISGDFETAVDEIFKRITDTSMV